MRLNLAFLCFITAFSCSQVAAIDRPNILLILADDLGYSDLGCYGSEIETPHLNALAESGLRFTQFYNTARCWPTRSSLLTGYYAPQIRRDHLPGLAFGNAGKRPNWAPLLPKLLKTAGYRSYHVGKWHIDGMPVKEGFDRSYYLKDQSRFFNPTVHYLDDIKLPAVEKDSGYYGTVEVANRAIEFLQQHQEAYSERPFFTYLAFAAPHFPLHALPADIDLYRDRYGAGWNALRAQRMAKMKRLGLLDPHAIPRASAVERALGPPYHFPESLETLGENEVNRPLAWNKLTAGQKQFQSTKMAIHAAMIHRMDIEIGRVLDQIETMGQTDNTLVMFLSDNGASAEIMVRADGHDPDAAMGSAESYLCLGPGWSTNSNSPFRRHKTWTHEGGISTPLVVAWPQGIEARGEVRTHVGHVIDVVPTLLDVSGVAVADTVDAPSPPGQSLASTFRSSLRDADDSRTLWWFHDSHKAIRHGDWKAVQPMGEPWELYDLASDRIESKDLAIVQHEKLSALTARWESLAKEFEAQSTQGLAPESVLRFRQTAARRSKMRTAQQEALPKRRQVIPGAETLMVSGRHAFIWATDEASNSESKKPWVLYSPTLPSYPDQAEQWMHQQLLDAGVSIAGLDVGEAYGSPHAIRHFDALYNKMIQRGYAEKPALLGRSRGGLWAMSWAIAHPDRVAAIGGIYPAFDYTTYPGVARAASAYGVSAEVLSDERQKYNPIERAGIVAEAQIPVCIIHGTDDKIVPLKENSLRLASEYRRRGASAKMQLIEVPGQGHSFWEGYFHCQPLVDFLIEQSRLATQGP